jgi:hypothetical protein
MVEFEREVDALKAAMDDLLQRAREAFRERDGEPAGGPSLQLESVEDIWQALENCTTIGEMQKIFNGLDPEKRQEVADFVLTELNIFKGAASTFSQHYNEEDCVLE